MVDLCLAASQSYPSGLVSRSTFRAFEDYQSSLLHYGSRQVMIRLDSLKANLLLNEELWKARSELSGASHFIRIYSTCRTILIDGRDACANSALFSLGIAEQCRRQKILNVLMSGLSERKISSQDLSLLCDLMGLQKLVDGVPQHTPVPDHILGLQKSNLHSSLIYPSVDFYSQKPLDDILSDLTNSSEITIYPDGQISLPGGVNSEFYCAGDSTRWRKQSILVPAFQWLDVEEEKATNGALKLETLKVPPLKSTKTVELNPYRKRKSSRKERKARNLYRNNYSRACESLLSIMIDKKRHAKTAIDSLKKSSPELPQLLTQLSASIAGTGLAVLFAVILRVASGRVAFASMLSTGVGIGLVWLSWAVNGLRSTVIQISKTSGKLVYVEEEMMKDLDRNVSEIYFRFVALVAVTLLRFA